MSDHFFDSWEPVMTGTKGGELRHPFRSQWTGQHLQPRCTSAPMVLQHCFDYEENSKGENFSYPRTSMSEEAIRSSNIFSTASLSMYRRDFQMTNCCGILRSRGDLVSEKCRSPSVSDEVKCAREDGRPRYQQVNFIKSSKQWVETCNCSGKDYSASASAFQSLFPRPNSKSVHSEAKNDSSFSKIVFKEHMESYSLSQSKHKSRNFHGRLAHAISERRKDSQSICKGSGTSGSDRKDESLTILANSWIGHFRLRMLTGEFDVKVQNNMVFSNSTRRRRMTRLDEFVDEHNLPQGLSESRMMETLQMRKNVLAESKEKGFFKMLDLPTGFSCNGKLGAKLQQPERAINGKKKEDGWGVGEDSSSSAGLNSLSSSKNVAVDLTEESPGTVSNPSTKRRALLFDMEMEHSPCYSDGNMEPCISRTETLGEKPENSSSINPSMESVVAGPDEPSSRWVKRLKLQSMDSFALGTNGLKIDDAPSNGGKAQKLFTRVLNYSRPSNSGESIAITSNRESPVESLKKSSSWIRRWCTTSSHKAPRIMAEEQKKLPSIAAMALMGKAVSNFRPSEFRRRGPSVVWNTDEGF